MKEKLSPVRSTPFHLGYRPCLDGLRGVAILMVLLDHAIPHTRGCYGFVGVDIFFVLSGFLITSLLLEEWNQSGRISLRAFYARRALRLLPALAAMLLAFLIYGAFAHTHRSFVLDIREAFTALLYSMNWAWAFDLGRITLLRHTWSLSIEEQFYFLWPAILILMLRFAKSSSILNFLFLGIFGSCLARFLLPYGWAITPGRMLCGLDTRADSLLLGCAIGVILFAGLLPGAAWVATGLRRGSVISVIGLAFISWRFLFFDPGMYNCGWILVSVFTAVILLAVATESGGLLRPVLEAEVLVCTGRFSYSLYLWHDPVIRATREHEDWSDWHKAAIYIPVTLLLAFGSYYLVERPCLQLKRKFQKVT